MRKDAASIFCTLCVFGIVSLVTLGLSSKAHIVNMNDINAWKHGTNGSCIVLRVSPVRLICADEEEQNFCSAYTTVYYSAVDVPDRDHSQAAPVGFGGIPIDTLTVGSIIECWSRDFERGTVVIWKIYERAAGPVIGIIIGTILSALFALTLLLFIGLCI